MRFFLAGVPVVLLSWSQYGFFSVAARYEFSLFYVALKKCSIEVIHVTSQHGRLIAWVAKDGWHGITAKHVQNGGRRPYYGGAMQLSGIGTVLRGDEAP